MERHKRAMKTRRQSTALHVSVTVRRIFSAAPAPIPQARERYFGGGPFRTRRLPALAGALLMDTAPLSTGDILTRCIIKVKRKISNIFGKAVDISPFRMVLSLSFKGTDARV